MGSKFRVKGKYLEGPNHMKIWPETVPSEVDKNLEKGIHFFIESLQDELRRKGHMTLTKAGGLINIVSVINLIF